MPESQLGRRQLWLLAGFLGATLVADFGLHHSSYRALVPEVVIENQVQRYARLVDRTPEDVLVLGSSRVQAGIDATAITRYIQGASGEALQARRLPFQGLTAWMLFQLIRDDIVPSPPKRLLVIGLEERLFYRPAHEAQDAMGFGLMNSLADWRDFDFFDLDQNQSEAVKLAPFRGLQLPWILPVLYHQGLSEFVQVLEDSRGKPPNTFRPISKAELSLVKSLRGEISARRKPGPEEQVLFPLELEAFDRCLRLLEKLPCAVRFVILPVEAEYELEEARGWAEFRERVLPKVSAAGFEVYDTNQRQELRQSGVFKNPSHVNDVGCISVSRLLAHDLIAPALGLPAAPEWQEDFWLPRLPEQDAGQVPAGAAPTEPQKNTETESPDKRAKRDELYRLWQTEQQQQSVGGALESGG